MNGDDMTYVFNADGVRDFALCTSADYTCTEGTAGDVTVRFYGTAPQAESGLSVACDAVETFSELYGEYPYDTLSVVMTPFIEGGMEYPSLVMISDSLGADMTKEAIIHETAHQWWYAAVGSDQINEPWLDEGLTEADAVKQGLIIRDTVRVAAYESLFGKGYPIDELRYVPFTQRKHEFLMGTNQVWNSDASIQTPVFEARVNNMVIFEDIAEEYWDELLQENGERKRLSKYPGLKVGDLKEANNNVGNWE